RGVARREFLPGLRSRNVASGFGRDGFDRRQEVRELCGRNRLGKCNRQQPGTRCSKTQATHEGTSHENRIRKNDRLYRSQFFSLMSIRPRESERPNRAWTIDFERGCSGAKWSKLSTIRSTFIVDPPSSILHPRAICTSRSISLK